MTRYAAFLRGINLAGNRSIGSAELRGAFEDAGLEDVGAFRTSGNVVFDGGRVAAATLKPRIEKGAGRCHRLRRRRAGPARVR